MWWLRDESIKALKRLAFVQPTGRAEGSGGRLEKWGTLYKISLGNPSDARSHYGCGYSMKERPLSGLPVLISSTHAKDTSRPSFILHLCARGPAADTGRQSQCLASSVASSSCALSLHTSMHVRTHTHFGQLQRILLASDCSQIQTGRS